MNSLKIFVVDDDPFYLHFMKKQLQNLGAEQVDLFPDGPSCLSSLDARPDVVFLDYHMDILNGYDILKKIKRSDPNIFVVMVSGQTDIKTAVDVLKQGAFDYIQKGEDGAESLERVMKKILQVKDQLERSRHGILKKIFQYL